MDQDPSILVPLITSYYIHMFTGYVPQNASLFGVSFILHPLFCQVSLISLVAVPSWIMLDG
jgi:hypothetical protein